MVSQVTARKLETKAPEILSTTLPCLSQTGEGWFLRFNFAMVNRVGNGGGSPTVGALCQFFDKVDADPDWFPGKANYDSCGHLQGSRYQCFNRSPFASTNFCSLSGSLWQSPSTSRFALMSATTRFNLASYCTEVCGRRHLHDSSMRPAYENHHL